MVRVMQIVVVHDEKATVVGLIFDFNGIGFFGVRLNKNFELLPLNYNYAAFLNKNASNDTFNCQSILLL